MKRSKKLITVLTIATLTLGFVGTAYGETTITVVAPTTKAVEVAPTTKAVEVAPVVSDVKAEIAAATTPAIVAPVAYDDLAYTEKIYKDTAQSKVGLYPIITGMDSLNKEIETTIYNSFVKTLANEESNKESSNKDKLSYTIKNDGQFAIVTITAKFTSFTTSDGSRVENTMFYINKEGMVQFADKAAYDAAVSERDTVTADAAAPAEATTVAPTEVAAVPTDVATTTDVATKQNAPVAKSVMVPLRKYADELGLTLKWNGKTKSIAISAGKTELTTIAVDKDSCTINGEKVTLDTAPTMVDGSVHVSSSLFELLCGATVTIGDNGEVTIAVVPVKAEPVVLTEPAVSAEPAVPAEIVAPVANPAA